MTRPPTSRPTAYWTCTGVTFHEPVAKDRVRARACAAKQRTTPTRSTVGYFDGWIGERRDLLAGHQRAARARLGVEVVKERLQDVAA